MRRITSSFVPSRARVTTVALVLLLLVAVIVEANLLGATDFPFRHESRSRRDRIFSRILADAESKCRFGNALVSAGEPGRAGTAKRIRPKRFAAAFARSFSGTSLHERRRIQHACLKGFARRETRPPRS